MNDINISKPNVVNDNDINRKKPIVIPDSLLKRTSLVISTGGSILNLNKKEEELIDSLKTTLKEPNYNESIGEISRGSTDLKDKILEHERVNIKIGTKVFLNNNSIKFLNEALNECYRVLGTDTLDNLILAYHPSAPNATPTPQKDGGGLEWGGNDINNFEDLKNLWSELENFSKDEKICQIGVSDLDANALGYLYNHSEVHPSIAQINLQSCCVVPPSLTEFCNKNEIQLLTHSDPEVILRNESLTELGLENFHPTWVIRYQVHVKCRGLLIAKGYIVGLSKNI